MSQDACEAIAERLECVLNLRMVTEGTKLHDIMEDCLRIARGVTLNENVYVRARRRQCTDHSQIMFMSCICYIILVITFIESICYIILFFVGFCFSYMGSQFEWLQYLLHHLVSFNKKQLNYVFCRPLLLGSSLHLKP